MKKQRRSGRMTYFCKRTQRNALDNHLSPPPFLARRHVARLARSRGTVLGVFMQTGGRAAVQERLYAQQPQVCVPGDGGGGTDAHGESAQGGGGARAGGATGARRDTLSHQALPSPSANPECECWIQGSIVHGT